MFLSLKIVDVFSIRTIVPTIDIEIASNILAYHYLIAAINGDSMKGSDKK